MTTYTAQQSARARLELLADIRRFLEEVSGQRLAVSGQQLAVSPKAESPSAVRVRNQTSYAKG